MLAVGWFKLEFGANAHTHCLITAYGTVHSDSLAWWYEASAHWQLVTIVPSWEHIIGELKKLLLSDRPASLGCPLWCNNSPKQLSTSADSEEIQVLTQDPGAYREKQCLLFGTFENPTESNDVSLYLGISVWKYGRCHARWAKEKDPSHFQILSARCKHNTVTQD